MSPSRLLRPFRRRDRGVAAVEFGIIAPVLLTLLAAAVDLGSYIERNIRLETAARLGAQYAIANPNDPQLQTNIVGLLNTNLASLPGRAVSVSQLYCLCPQADGSMTGTPNTADCNRATNNPCTTGLARFRVIEVCATYTALLPFRSFLPNTQCSANSTATVGTVSRRVVARV